MRDRSLNVYYRGASLFRITPVGAGVSAETHVKYLVRQRQALTQLGQDGGFALDPGTAVWTRYEGPGTLAEMKRAAAALSGLEKAGVHALVKASPNVVDVEIALTGAPMEAASSEREGAEADAMLLAPDNEASATPTPAQTRQDRSTPRAWRNGARPTRHGWCSTRLSWLRTRAFVRGPPGDRHANRTLPRDTD